MSQLTTQPSPACSDVMPGPSSWPCSGRPASSRNVSRAPRPAGSTPAPVTASHTSTALRRGHRELDTVLARVAGAGDDAPDPVPLDRGDAEPSDRRGLGPHGRQPFPRRRTLHRDHRSVPGHVSVLADPQRLPHPLRVRCVGHHVESVVGDPPDDDVVEHRGVVLVEQVGVLGSARPDLAQVVGQRQLQPFERIRSRHSHRAEVADVEGDRPRPAGTVFRERAAGVGQWHLPSPEGHELGAEGAVDGVER